MRRLTGPALLAIAMAALVMAASSAWAQERAPGDDPVRVNDTFECEVGYTAVPDDAADAGFTCVEDPVDPESGTHVTFSTSPPPVDQDGGDGDGDGGAEPPGPTGNTYGDVIDCPIDQDQPGTDERGTGRTICEPTTTTTGEDDEGAGSEDGDEDGSGSPGPTTTTGVPDGTASPVTTTGDEVVPSTTTAADSGELPFTGTGPAVLIAGLTFLAIGAVSFLVARLKPGR